eukprot:scaffold87428_cov30-Tisochrysis_lutea.AAC.1
MGRNTSTQLHEQLDRQVTKRPTNAHTRHGWDSTQSRPDALIVCGDPRNDSCADQQAHHEERLDAYGRRCGAWDALDDLVGAVGKGLKAECIDSKQVLPLARQHVCHDALHILLHLSVQAEAVKKRAHARMQAQRV